MTKLHIKNMVCDRCILTVRRLLEEEKYSPSDVKLGEASVLEEPHEVDMERMQWKLRDLGFDLVFDRDEQLVVLSRAAIIRYLQSLETGKEKRKLSAYLSDELDTNYQKLSRTFSEKSDDTIEQYFIRLKIERVKELLSYDEYTLSEIAWKLDYSSVQHLSQQFKKSTGVTVREWKSSEIHSRTKLDEL